MIDILLSTYNGEKFIEQQIESLLKQTYTNWNLIIRDDGSTDGTKEILYRYTQKYPNKISADISNSSNMGVIRSFEVLLQKSQSDYIMFCDQDDIWLPHKIELSLIRMQQLEMQYGSNKPIMIHTDLTVTDANMTTLDKSFWHYANIRPQILNNNIKYLSVCNSATGCTIMLNKAGKDISLPFPPNILMHDSWIASNICRHGIVEAIPKSTILYRQHHSNTLGANKYSHNLIRKILNIRHVLQDVPMIYNTYPDIFNSRTEVFFTKLKYSLLLYFTKQ